MTSGGKALTNEIAQKLSKCPLFNAHPRVYGRRELATDRERRDSCNKRFSLVKLGGCAEAMVISREFNVTGTSKLYFFAARLHTSFVAAALARFLSRYTQHSRMQPVAVARKLKVTYCSSLREPTRREAVFS